MINLACFVGFVVFGLVGISLVNSGHARWGIVMFVAAVVLCIVNVFASAAPIRPPDRHSRFIDAPVYPQVEPPSSSRYEWRDGKPVLVVPGPGSAPIVPESDWNNPAPPAEKLTGIWKDWPVVDSGHGWTQVRVPCDMPELGYTKGDVRIILHRLRPWPSLLIQGTPEENAEADAYFSQIHGDE